VTEKHAIQAQLFLEPGETILALAVCQRPPRIEVKRTAPTRWWR
jgi:hypothetical protein